jgi:hypothetical protein
MTNEISESLFDQARKLEDLGKYKETADLYLQAALDLIKQNEIDQAVKNLMLVARTYEKDQDWRKVGALWDSIGEHRKRNWGHPIFLLSREKVRKNKTFKNNRF